MSASQTEQEILPSLQAGKGTLVRFLVDSQSPPTWRKLEMSCDGEPDSEVFEVPRHWHKHHDEYWTVLEGRMEVFVDGKSFEVAAGDKTLMIPRLHVHGMKSFKGEKLVFTETADPAGPYKEAFIRDMFQMQKSPNFLLAMRVMYDGDTYPALGGPKLLDQLFISVVGTLATLFSPTKPSAASTSAT